MRPKSKWNKNAIFADILNRLGRKLSKKSMWERYLLIVETTDSGCELAEKAANLLFSDDEVKSLINEMDEFYGNKKSVI